VSVDPVTMATILAGGLGSAAGSGGGGESTTYFRKLRLVQEYKFLIEQSKFTEADRWKKKHPELAKEIERGRWLHVMDPRTVIRQRELAKPAAPARLGDFPLRSPVDKLPAIGAPMRSIATGALRVAGPASWALFAGSMIPTEWWRKTGNVFANLPHTAPMVPGGMGTATGTRGGELTRRALGEGRAAQRAGGRVTPMGPPPAGSMAMPAPRAVGSQTTAAPVAPGDIQPVKVTAKKIPVPEKPSRAAMILGALAKTIPQLATLFSKKQDGRSVAKPVTNITNVTNVNPFAESPPQPDPGLTPVEPDGATCDCQRKPKQSKPKEPRTVCRIGRYIERSSGLQKSPERKIPCRQSRKKRA